jgi:hypothetical protein
MLLGLVYGICDTGFPVPVPGAGRITSEGMAALNPPSVVGDTLCYCGAAMVCVGSLFQCLRFCRWFIGGNKS